MQIPLHPLSFCEAPISLLHSFPRLPRSIVLLRPSLSPSRYFPIWQPDTGFISFPRLTAMLLPPAFQRLVL